MSAPESSTKRKLIARASIRPQGVAGQPHRVQINQWRRSGCADPGAVRSGASRRAQGRLRASALERRWTCTRLRSNEKVECAFQGAAKVKKITRMSATIRSHPTGVSRRAQEAWTRAGRAHFFGPPQEIVLFDSGGEQPEREDVVYQCATGRSLLGESRRVRVDSGGEETPRSERTGRYPRRRQPRMPRSRAPPAGRRKSSPP